MKTDFRILGVALLSFVGFTALYCGFALMIDPSGEFINLPVEKLKFSPFADFLIPGVILFFVLGLGSLLVIPVVIKDTPESTNFMILAGIIISGWIVVQMIMALEVHWLQGVYIAIALALIFIGIKAEARQESKR